MPRIHCLCHRFVQMHEVNWSSRCFCWLSSKSYVSFHWNNICVANNTFRCLCFCRMLFFGWEIIHEQLYEYLLKTEIINPKQKRLQKRSSNCKSCHSCVRPYFVRDTLSKGNIVTALFIDLGKAFDTVDHSILLRKLHHYRVHGTEQKWFESYPSGRHQATSGNEI